MASGGRKLLGQVLVDLGLISEDQLKEVLVAREARSEPTGTVAVELGYVTEDQMTEALAEQSGMEKIDLD